MRKIRWMSGYFVGLILLAASMSTAVAQTKAPDFSSYPQLDHLGEELVEEWENNPGAFARFDTARGAFPQIYERRRGTYVNLARPLEGLGEERLLPILWALASDDPRERGYDLMMWWNWRVGLLESVGRLADERSAPVLMHIIEGPDPHGLTRQVAASAVGRIGDADLIEDVIDVARESSEKRSAIIVGLGHARRGVAADYLLEQLAQEEDDEERRLIVRALGDWGNQWAWQTSSLEPYLAEGRKGQSEIITALVERYPRAPSLVQAEIVKSLQLNGASTSAVQARERARAADQSQDATLWHRLAERLERSVLE